MIEYFSLAFRSPLLPFPIFSHFPLIESHNKSLNIYHEIGSMPGHETTEENPTLRQEERWIVKMIIHVCFKIHGLR